MEKYDPSTIQRLKEGNFSGVDMGDLCDSYCFYAIRAMAEGLRYHHDDWTYSSVYKQMIRWIVNPASVISLDSKDTNQLINDLGEEKALPVERDVDPTRVAFEQAKHHLRKEGLRILAILDNHSVQTEYYERAKGELQRESKDADISFYFARLNSSNPEHYIHSEDARTKRIALVRHYYTLRKGALIEDSYEDQLIRMIKSCIIGIPMATLSEIITSKTSNRDVSYDLESNDQLFKRRFHHIDRDFCDMAFYSNQPDYLPLCYYFAFAHDSGEFQLPSIKRMPQPEHRLVLPDEPLLATCPREKRLCLDGLKFNQGIRGRK